MWPLAFILTLTFLVLRIMGTTDWKWRWVFSPLWIMGLLWLVAGAIVMIVLIGLGGHIAP